MADHDEHQDALVTERSGQDDAGYDETAILDDDTRVEEAGAVEDYDDEGYDVDEGYDEPRAYSGVVSRDDDHHDDEAGWAGEATNWDLTTDDDEVGHLVLTNVDSDVSINVPINEELIEAMCHFTDFYPEESKEYSALTNMSGWPWWSRQWEQFPPAARRAITWGVLAIVVLTIVLNVVL